MTGWLVSDLVAVALTMSEPTTVSPLARFLLDLNADGRGMSWRRMELEAYKAGYRYSSSAFHQVARDERRRPLDRAAAEAIGAGTGTTAAHILDLDARRWRGSTLTEPAGTSNDDLIDALAGSDLTPAQIQRVLLIAAERLTQPSGTEATG